MITYIYRCLNCSLDGFEFEAVQSMSDERIAECPRCNHDTSETVIVGGAFSIISSEPKTLGGLAHQNNKRNGRAWREDKEREVKQDYRNRLSKRRQAMAEHLDKIPGASLPERDPDYKPFWRKGPVDKKLATLSKEAQFKYVKHEKK